MGRKVGLTEQGEKLAEHRQGLVTTGYEVYPEGRYEAGLDEIWTVGDDILVMLNGPMAVDSQSDKFRHQQEAVIQAMELIHPRAHAAAAFRIVCQQGLVDCVFNVLDAQEEAAEVFEALSDVTRLQMLRLLFEQPLRASDLSRVMEKTSATIYYHLGKLKDAQLVYSVGHGIGYAADSEYIVDILMGIVEFFAGKEDE